MNRLILRLVRYLMRWLPEYRLFDMREPEDVRHLIRLWLPNMHIARNPRRKREAHDELYKAGWRAPNDAQHEKIEEIRDNCICGTDKSLCPVHPAT